MSKNIDYKTLIDVIVYLETCDRGMWVSQRTIQSKFNISDELIKSDKWLPLNCNVLENEKYGTKEFMYNPFAYNGEMRKVTKEYLGIRHIDSHNDRFQGYFTESPKSIKPAFGYDSWIRQKLNFMVEFGKVRNWTVDLQPMYQGPPVQCFTVWFKGNNKRKKPYELKLKKRGISIWNVPGLIHDEDIKQPPKEKLPF